MRFNVSKGILETWLLIESDSIISERTPFANVQWMMAPGLVSGQYVFSQSGCDIKHNNSTLFALGLLVMLL